MGILVRCRMTGLAVAVLLAGCAAPVQIQPGAARAEVEAAKGVPTSVWSNPDGTETLEYSTQPNGTSNLFVIVDRGGRVVQAEETLTEERFARVQDGMTVEEIGRLLGKYRSENTYRSGETVRDWKVSGKLSGYREKAGRGVYFNVHFRDGKVVRTSRSADAGGA